MIRTFATAALLLLITLALSPVANSSVKERGGGNITSDGELADLEFVRSATEMTSEVSSLLDQPLKHLLPLAPDFAALFFTTGLDGKETRYFLTSYEIQDSECSLKAPVAMNAAIAACNIKISDKLSEVYINARIWKKASPKDRLDLVVHEQLRSHQLRLGAQNDVALFRLTDSVSRFIALANRKDATLGQKENAIREVLQISFQGGFGAYDLGLTIHAVTDAAVVAFDEACANTASAWPTSKLSTLGAPLLAELLDRSLDQRLFTQNRQAFCASLHADAERAVSGYPGEADLLYPLYWR